MAISCPHYRFIEQEDYPIAGGKLNHSNIMFIGHFGVGFGAKSVAPRVSLGTLFMAAQFIDLLWPTLLLLGVEHVEIAPGITRVTPLNFISYPVSHCRWPAHAIIATFDGGGPKRFPIWIAARNTIRPQRP